MTDIVLEVVSAARRYFQKNQTLKPGITLSYKYFTDHPIAPLNHKRTQEILEHSNAISNSNRSKRMTILDFACGGGIISTVLGKAGFSVVGIDLDRQEIALAKDFSTSLGLKNMTFIVASTTQPWEKKVLATLATKPDIYLFAYALHHFEDVEVFIKRLSTFAKKGSYLVINEENPNSVLWRLKHAVRTVIQKDTDVEHQRTPDGWDQLLKKHGFKLVRYTGVDFLPPWLVRKKYEWSYIMTYVKK